MVGRQVVLFPALDMYFYSVDYDEDQCALEATAMLSVVYSFKSR